MQEIIQSLPRIQDTKLSLDDSPNGRTVENGYTVFLGGSCLQATAKLWLSMAGKFGRLTWPGLFGEFVQAASIVLGQPLLDGPTGTAGNLHDLGTGQPHFGQVDPLDTPRQPCIGLGTIESLCSCFRLLCGSTVIVTASLNLSFTDPLCSVLVHYARAHELNGNDIIPVCQPNLPLNRFSARE